MSQITEDHIVEFWVLFKEYIDKKNVETVAERYVDLLADFGVDDVTFRNAMDTDDTLDEAINYYLDEEEVETFEEEETDWD